MGIKSKKVGFTFDDQRVPVATFCPRCGQVLLKSNRRRLVLSAGRGICKQCGQPHHKALGQEELGPYPAARGRVSQISQQRGVSMSDTALTDADHYELEGMRAALKYAAATHNPYLFGRGTPEQAEAWAKGQAAVEQYNMAQREQQMTFLHEQGMLLEMLSDPALEIGRLRQALRNVLRLVWRAQRHEQQGRAPVPDLWATLIRFCAEGGVMPSILRAEVVPEAATDTPPPPSAAQVLELLAVWVESSEAQAEAEEVDDMPTAIPLEEVSDRALTELSHLAPTHLRSLAAELEQAPLTGWTKLHVVDSKLYGSHPRFKSMAFIADLDVSPVLGLEFETYWKAGFLRGAKFWYSKTEAATMWQSEQNECWQAAHKLWPLVRPESLNDARAIARAFAEESP